MVSSLDVFDSQWRARLLALNICEPAKVVSFSEAERTCVVAPAFLIGTRAGEEPRTNIEDVSVLFPVIGGLSAQYELMAGDDVLLVYTQRDVLKWWEDGAAALPDNNRLFGTPIAIPLAREDEGRDMRLVRGDSIIEMTEDVTTITQGQTVVEIVGNRVTITSDDVEFTGNLTVKGDLTTEGVLTAEGDVTTEGTLRSEGALIAQGTLRAQGALTADSTLTAAGAVVAQSGLTVAGTADLNGNLDVAGAFQGESNWDWRTNTQQGDRRLVAR